MFEKKRFLLIRPLFCNWMKIQKTGQKLVKKLEVKLEVIIVKNVKRQKRN